MLGLLSGKRPAPAPTVTPAAPPEKAPPAAAAAPPPAPVPVQEEPIRPGADQDAKLAEMLARIQQMTSAEPAKGSPVSPLAAVPPLAPATDKGPESPAPLDAFIPLEPNSIREA